MFDFFVNRILIIIPLAIMAATIIGMSIIIYKNPIHFSIGYLIIGTAMIALRYDKDKTWKENFKILKERDFFDPLRIALFLWFSTLVIAVIVGAFFDVNPIF
tara:strand:+ start:209 stop:514 length:306 start_codon:yes stop_codon:yes gene_type:complete